MPANFFSETAQAQRVETGRRPGLRRPAPNMPGSNKTFTVPRPAAGVRRTDTSTTIHAAGVHGKLEATSAPTSSPSSSTIPTTNEETQMRSPDEVAALVQAKVNEAKLAHQDELARVNAENAQVAESLRDEMLTDKQKYEKACAMLAPVLSQRQEQVALGGKMAPDAEQKFLLGVLTNQLMALQEHAARQEKEHAHAMQDMKGQVAYLSRQLAVEQQASREVSQEYLRLLAEERVEFVLMKRDLERRAQESCDIGNRLWRVKRDERAETRRTMQGDKKEWEDLAHELVGTADELKGQVDDLEAKKGQTEGELHNMEETALHLMDLLERERASAVEVQRQLEEIPIEEAPGSESGADAPSADALAQE